ncbi:uncharacterized protein RHIMIDRAFT_241138 [Rhizopus microsporus ATCC 52813]|uniref:Uncharacterized protein n=1 Tax=Rhizopus microsporus ATCC 52813 TaxID=1340429 RepID=A0A2G4SJJ9_RHIZD|nr:uncharacterized protein RHIMIDRAFT_241138 [Rhizopus microsporus ATCC 52813]PHZ08922.1 hypothetical protein RHIMIDRAFT_241138 [Rhizopus microsporus ATCC 52813]
MSNGLSLEEINELQELRGLLKRQQVQDDKDEPRSLLNEVRLEMEQAPPSQLKNKLRQYARNTSKYEGDFWTKSGTVNRIYLPEFKKYNVDAVQHINAISKGADRLRTAARGATELFSDIQ